MATKSKKYVKVYFAVEGANPEIMGWLERCTINYYQSENITKTHYSNGAFRTSQVVWNAIMDSEDLVAFKLLNPTIFKKTKVKVF